MGGGQPRPVCVVLKRVLVVLVLGTRAAASWRAASGRNETNRDRRNNERVCVCVCRDLPAAEGRQRRSAARGRQNIGAAPQDARRPRIRVVDRHLGKVGGSGGRAAKTREPSEARVFALRREKAESGPCCSALLLPLALKQATRVPPKPGNPPQQQPLTTAALTALSSVPVQSTRYQLVESCAPGA